MSNKYIVVDNSIRPINTKSEITIGNELPIWPINIYVTKEGLILEKEKDIELPQKVYGELNDVSNHILNTFQSRIKKTTGVLLSGIKGTGKTLLANILCKNANLPVIKITNPDDLEIIIDFLKSLDSPYVLFIDEFEKKFPAPFNSGSKNDTTTPLYNFLSFLDGGDTNQKLVILTVNKVNVVAPELLERPSRIFYHFKYSGLTELEIEEYMSDYLAKNYPVKDRLDEIKNTIRDELTTMSSFGGLTFDMLTAILEEVCRYPDISLAKLLSNLNIGLLEINISGRLEIWRKDTDEIISIPETVQVSAKTFEIDRSFYLMDQNKVPYRLSLDIGLQDFITKKDNKFYFRKGVSHFYDQKESKDVTDNFEIIFTPIVSSGWKASPLIKENIYPY